MKKILFVLLFTLVGLQSAFALSCSDKTIYFKAPENWTDVYLFSAGRFVLIPKTYVTNGWYVFPSEMFGESFEDRIVFVAAEDFYSAGVTANTFNDGRFDQMDYISCGNIASESIYIYENPATQGKTVVSSVPPNAKYFFVMIPPEPLTVCR